MPFAGDLRARRSQRGQTILLVAISMVSLLAMAALAIDVVTLYVARTEVQRAADAAALAGAKALADSGMTTLQPSDGSLPDAITLAKSMATSAINAVVSASSPMNNAVAGSTPTLATGYPTFNTALNYNPTVTVVLQQTNLPTFFARIWGASASTTSASATAEAYNPSNQQSFTPITPRCVKPWLVANLDPTNPSLGAHFIDPTSGTVVSNLARLTTTPFDLQADCRTTDTDCSNPIHTTMESQNTSPPWVEYVPMLVTPSSADACPACADTTNGFEEGTACCYAATYFCGGNQPNADWDPTVSPEHGRATGPAAVATECLIHASTTGPGNGQDLLDYPSAWPSGPAQITAGTANPMSSQVVTTSSSIVTIPIIAPAGFTPPNPGPVTVLGFLQAFVNEVSNNTGPPNHTGEINITVMNVIACSQTPNGNAPIIGGNGASAIPVRLISPP
jgi:hypothetical protein